MSPGQQEGLSSNFLREEDCERIRFVINVRSLVSDKFKIPTVYSSRAWIYESGV